MQFYQVNLLKDPNHPGPARLLDHVNRTVIPDIEKQGITVFGVFQGLFGLASNELYLVTSSQAGDCTPDLRIHHDGFEVVESISLIPTRRPTDHSRRTREGIYVFRWFDVMNRHIEEIADLSAKAWVTFEEGFDTQVQCLFAQMDQNPERGRMLLITWYKDLWVWQESRQPSTEARENFQRRQQLILQARPVATRLV
jgi:hypothetical protein